MLKSRMEHHFDVAFSSIRVEPQYMILSHAEGWPRGWQ